MMIENGINRDKPFPKSMKIQVVATVVIIGTNEIEVSLPNLTLPNLTKINLV